MKTLQTIQKTLDIFKKLTKVAYVLCIVGAITAAVGAVCAGVGYNGGNVFSLYGEPIELFPEGTDLRQKCAELLSATLTLSANAILLWFLHGYLKGELADGTPFTEKGAEQLKKIGIRFIYIPIVAIAISEVIAALLGVKNAEVADNFGSLATGIVLILVSLIFRYGAELEQKNREAECGEEKPIESENA